LSTHNPLSCRPLFALCALRSYFPHASNRPQRAARSGSGRCGRQRFWIRDFEGPRGGRRHRVCRHLATRAQHLPDPARAREDRRCAAALERLAPPVRTYLPAGCCLRHHGRCSSRCAGQQALQGHRRLFHRGPRRADRRRLWPEWHRHSRPFPGQRTRGEEGAHRYDARRLHGRGRRQRVLDGLDDAKPGPADGERWQCDVPDLPGQ